MVEVKNCQSSLLPIDFAISLKRSVLNFALDRIVAGSKKKKKCVCVFLKGGGG